MILRWQTIGCFWDFFRTLESPASLLRVSLVLHEDGTLVFTKILQDHYLELQQSTANLDDVEQHSGLGHTPYSQMAVKAKVGYRRRSSANFDSSRDMAVRNITFRTKSRSAPPAASFSGQSTFFEIPTACLLQYFYNAYLTTDQVFRKHASACDFEHLQAKPAYELS